MKRAYTGVGVTASGPYSHAVESDGFIFFSGQTAMNGELPILKKESISKQVELVFEHLEAVMTASQVSFSDVVKVNVYLTSMAYFEEMNHIYQEKFKDPFPARTCVAVKELPLEADVEIEMIARRK